MTSPRLRSAHWLAVAAFVVTPLPATAQAAQESLASLTAAYRGARFAEFDSAAARVDRTLLGPRDYAVFHQLLGFAALARRDTAAARRSFRDSFLPGGGVPADSTLHSPARREIFSRERLLAPMVTGLELQDSSWRSLDERLRLAVGLSQTSAGVASVQARWCERTAWRGTNGNECYGQLASTASPVQPSGVLELQTAPAGMAPASGPYEVALVSRANGYEVQQVWRAIIATEAPLGSRLPDAPTLLLVGETKTVGGWAAHPVAGPVSLLTFAGSVWGAITLGKRTDTRGDSCVPDDRCAQVGGLYLSSLVSFFWVIGTAGGKKVVSDGDAIRENQRRRGVHNAAVTEHAARVAEMKRVTVSRVTQLERIQ